MQPGKFDFTFPTLNVGELEKLYIGVDFKSAVKIIEYLKSITKNRKTYLMLFIYPNVKNMSEELSLPPKEVYHSLKFLSNFTPDLVKYESYFQLDSDNIFEPIQEEDIKLLTEKNEYQNPFKPDIIYKDADKYVRFVFKIGKPNES